MRVLNKQAHKARVKELRSRGCKVKVLKRREGTVVLKRCPPGTDLSGLDGGTPKWLAGGLALAGAVAVFNLVKTADPNAA